MNEINISIPYMLFKDVFTTYFYARMNNGFCVSAHSAIDAAKKYWMLFVKGVS
ncbi:hypothetical protein AANUM_1126 [Aggregatibacter actinomycetemcomitans NUM4039]|nr:hypothetical protein [Aggregatibacter actinomycetemcomitans]BAS48357.1 hypothetical protein AANUM_1126 [Aggregatibacter actinomycetemcomitans NUM4039]